MGDSRPDSGLSAGVGRADITPPVGILHGGWGAQTHSRATGIDLPLWATALVITDGDTGVVILDLDLGILTVDDGNVLRAQISEVTGFPVGNVRASYTHTHAGPVWSGAFGDDDRPGNELVADYRVSVFARTVGAVREAMEGLQPCRLDAGYGRSEIGVNRRLTSPDGRVVVSQNPDGFKDPTLLAVRIDDLDERPLASIVGFGAHPIILAFQNSLISPDYPGVAKRVVELATGAPCLFLQGCAGDQMTVEGLTGDTAVSRRMGTRLGYDASSVLIGLKSKPVSRRWDRVVESGAPLGMWIEEPSDERPVPLVCAVETLHLPLRDLPEVAEARASADELVGVAVAMARSDTSAPEDRAEANFRAKRASMIARWSEWGGDRGYLETELHGIRIGPVGLVGFPGEPFASIGADARNNSPLPFTHLGGYTNGWLGYVPTASEFPRAGYEVEWGSAYTDKAADLLTEGVSGLLNRLSEPS